MIAKVLKSFYDKNEGVTRNEGDTFTASTERFNELVSTKFGKLVDEVAEATESVAIKKPKTNTKKTDKKQVNYHGGATNRFNR